MADTSTRKCNCCGQVKSLLLDFYRTGYKERRKTICKVCCRKYHNKEYRKSYKTINRKYYTILENKRVQENKQKAIELFGSKCLDCQKSFPSCVYDFHHIDPTTKDKTYIALFGRSWDRIKIELDKCVMLCANCHRIRHFG